MSAEVAPRSRMTAAQRREQLLDVTKRLASRRGFHAVSIEAVAREAGITRPIVYGHFTDLQGLLDALVEREGARALEQLACVLPGSLAEGDPRETLVGCLEGYLRAVQADPDTWRLVLMPPEGAPDSLREGIETGRAQVVALLAQAMGFGGFVGAVPDPELLAHALSAMADQSARLLLTDPQTYPVARHLDAARWFLGRLDVG